MDYLIVLAFLRCLPTNIWCLPPPPTHTSWHSRIRCYFMVQFFLLLNNTNPEPPDIIAKLNNPPDVSICVEASKHDPEEEMRDYFWNGVTNSAINITILWEAIYFFMFTCLLWFFDPFRLFSALFCHTAIILRTSNYRLPMYVGLMIQFQWACYEHMIHYMFVPFDIVFNFCFTFL